MGWQDHAEKDFKVGNKYYYHDDVYGIDVLTECFEMLQDGKTFGFRIMKKDPESRYVSKYIPSGGRFYCEAYERCDGVKFVYVHDGKDDMHPKPVLMTAWDRWGKLDEF